MIKKIIFSIVGLIITTFVITEFSYWFAQTSVEKKRTFDSCTVLVLGYPSNPDGSPHPIQQLRVETAVEIFQTYNCSIMITTGGAVRTKFIQAEIMAQIAENLGIAKQQLIIENKSGSSWENIGCAMPHLNGAVKIFVVSDSLHSHRGKRYLCRQNPDLCSLTTAMGGYDAFSMLLWKVPAFYHELRAWVRDIFIYENKPWDNDSICPD